MTGDGGVNAGKIEGKLAQVFGALGNHLDGDVELQEEIDARLAEFAGSISPSIVDVAGEYFKKVIEGWKPDDVADKLEAEVGKELQYIRLNGTLLGFVAGLLLFLAVEGVL